MVTQWHCSAANSVWQAPQRQKSIQTCWLSQVSKNIFFLATITQPSWTRSRPSATTTLQSQGSQVPKRVTQYGFRFSSCHMPRDCNQNVDIDTINHPSLRVTPSARRSAGQSPKLRYIGLNALANNKDDIVIRQTFLNCICLSIDHSLQQESNCHSRQIILIHMNCHQILAKEHACLHVHSYLKAKQSFNWMAHH